MHQIENALRSLADPSQVDLVLVNGCINDVDSRRLLNAANTPDSIREFAQAKCGPPVEALLNQDHARLSVCPRGDLRLLPDHLGIHGQRPFHEGAGQALLHSGLPTHARLNDKGLRARLIAISREWYQTSDQMLANAARKIDSELEARGSHQRVMFADAAFRPEHSFAANRIALVGALTHRP